MPQNVTQKLISTHLADGSPLAGAPITLKIDQTLTQDATGTLVMLTLEAIGLAWVTTEGQRTICRSQSLAGRQPERRRRRRFGIWYSRRLQRISGDLRAAVRRKSLTAWTQ
jgi:aconitate hydratase